MPAQYSDAAKRLSIAFLVAALPACGDDGGSMANNSQGGQGGNAGDATAVGGDGGTGVIMTGGTGGSTGGSGGGANGPCEPATALICDTSVEFPAMISETGIFPMLPDVAQHHERAHLFQPNPPLWSDGLGKERLVILPADGVIDNTDPIEWDFPDGTIFVKSFFDDGGPAGARRPVETRFIRRGQDPIDPFSKWEFAVYQWDTAGADATLISFADPMMTTPQQVVVDHMVDGEVLRLNNGEEFTHQIPSKQQCQSCHDANAKLTSADIIGFDELRLNWALPGEAKTQLETLVERGVLSTMPAAPATIVEADPVLARVKSWVQGNCVHCHNGAEGMLDLRPDVFVDNTVNMDSGGAGIMPPDDTWKRIVPGDPEKSILYVQSRRAPLPTGVGIQMRPMPPEGVEIAHMNRPNAATDPPEYMGQLPPGTFASEVPYDPIADMATWINGLQ